MGVRRVLPLCLAALVLIGAAGLPAPAASEEPEAGDEHEMDCTRPIQYDLYTQRKLDQYLHEIYMGYVRLIETYAWEGGMTQEQKVTRLKYLKNYIQEFSRHRYQWCSEHEPDEWEEEWFNRD